MIIDFNDNVAHAQALDCEPFPITLQRARLSTPPAQQSSPGVHFAEFADFLKDLDKLDQQWAQVHAAAVESANPQVQWDAPEGHQDDRNAPMPQDDASQRALSAPPTGTAASAFPDGFSVDRPNQWGPIEPSVNFEIGSAASPAGEGNPSGKDPGQ